MFARLFKQKDKKNDIAGNLYQSALSQTLNPRFYEEWGVPDSFDGRFDLLLVHLFIILRRLKEHSDYEEIAQSLFDLTFKNMDQTLREMGIGDMGIPKHMKRMMKAFNGRMHSYLVAIEPESLKDMAIDVKQTTLDEALRRNLFGTVEEKKINQDHILKMVAYVKANLENKESGEYSEFEWTHAPR